MQPAQRVENNFFPADCIKSRRIPSKLQQSPIYWVTFVDFLAKKKRDFDKFSSNRC